MQWDTAGWDTIKYTPELGFQLINPYIHPADAGVGDGDEDVLWCGLRTLGVRALVGHSVGIGNTRRSATLGKNAKLRNQMTRESDIWHMPIFTSG